MNYSLAFEDSFTLGPDADWTASRRGVPAWLLSVGFHLAIMLVIGLLPTRRLSQPPSEPDRAAGIALVHRSQSKTTYFTESNVIEVTTALSNEVNSQSLALPSISNVPIDLAVALPSAPAAMPGGIGVLPGADGFTTGNQPSRRLSGGQASTQVFGAQGNGSKFVYVFDRSASMEGFAGRPMAAAKSQLLASLNDLDTVHQFQIVFYNHRVSVFNPFAPRPPQMMFGSKENKELAKDYIQGIVPAGSTRHMQALRLAIDMQPDVIFFLTDAAEPELTPGELQDIRQHNRGTVINAIEFGSGPFPGGENFLMKLARQNGGKHVYVDVATLR